MTGSSTASGAPVMTARVRPSARLAVTGGEAQEMFLQAYEEAVQAYGATDEAYRIAYAALKRQFEKRGDHWIAKTESAA